MHKQNFKIILSFLLILTSNFIFSQKKFTIVLDAGHGGSDHGANRTYSDIGRVAEKDITLAITLKVGAMLEKNRDFKVIYTVRLMSTLLYLTGPIWPTGAKQIYLYPFTVILLKDLQLMVQKRMYRDLTRITKTLK